MGKETITINILFIFTIEELNIFFYIDFNNTLLNLKKIIKDMFDIINIKNFSLI